MSRGPVRLGGPPDLSELLERPATKPGLTKILLVEDNPAHARLVRELLFEAWGTMVEICECHTLREVDGPAALWADCILLDLTLPDAEGLEAVLELRTVAPEVPIVVLSSRVDEDVALRAVQQGAQDYLTKSRLDASLLSRSVRYAIERKGLEAQLAHQALHDGLTGLPNRALLLDRVARSLIRGERRSGAVAMYFVDLDGFKAINDSHGHAAGDKVLATVAGRLQEALRPEDTVARFGGDEFCAVCADIVDPDHAIAIARRIVEALGAPIRLGPQEVWITASIGIAMSDDRDDGQNAESLIHDADRAMYRAKRLGKDRYELHDATDASRTTRCADEEAALRRAIEENQLVLHYQPIMDLTRSAVAGVEALVRWNHPERGLLHPGDFVPFAERTGLIVPLGAWVLNEACRQANRWRARWPGSRPLTMSVNLSAGQLSHIQLVDLVAGTLDATGTPPSELWLEVTETVVMQDIEASIETLENLRHLGVSVSVDDFGTGHSSLAYLSRLPAGILKVDRAFVSRLGSSADDGIIVSAVVDLAHALGMGVVAEGVETVAQQAAVEALGCEFAQGFHLARPQPADIFEASWSALTRS